MAARYYRIHYSGNTVRVVNRTPAPIQTPATPPTGSSRNPIEVSSASPKKKRNRIEVGSVSPKKKRD